MQSPKSPRKTSPLPSRNERRKDARPGELLSAALDLFVEKGFSATKVEDVAHRAGVSKGTLFLYFPSKAELFKAVVRENISGRISQWNAEIDAFEGSTSDMLRHFVQLWWQRLGSTKASGITKLMLGEGKNFPDLEQFFRSEVVEPTHQLIRRILLRGVERGEFDPAVMKYGVYTLLAPMIFLQLSLHSPSLRSSQGNVLQLVPEDYLEAQLQTLLAGLCLRPPATPLVKGIDSP